MKISTIHQKFADYLEKPEALQHPENFLGPNWLTVINFWLFLDTLSKEQLKTVTDCYDAAWWHTRNAARYAAWYDVALSAARPADWTTAGEAAWGAAFGEAAAWATLEIIGSHILIEQGKSLFFLPMFNDL